MWILVWLVLLVWGREGLHAQTPAGAQPTDNPILRIGFSQFPSTLHPYFDAMMTKSFVLGAVNRPMATWDADWKYRCLLCVRVPALEDGTARRIPDGQGGEHLELELALQPGLRWGDGVAVTTADIVFTWELMRKPETGAIAGEYFRRIVRMEAIDPQRLVIVIDRVNYDYFETLSMVILPRHLEAGPATDPASYRTNSHYTRNPTHPGLYSGPWLVNQVEWGQHIELVPNPHFKGPKPPWRRVDLTATENHAALERRLLAGDVDLVPAAGGFTGDRAAALERRHRERIQVRWRSGLFYEQITLNHQTPPLDNPQVREALAISIDRALMVERLLGPQFSLAHGPAAPADPIFPDAAFVEQIALAYDVARAESLLDQAGWRMHDDGPWRTNAAGEPLRLEMVTTAGSSLRSTIAEFLKSEWQGIGVELVIREQIPRILFGETLRTRSFRHMAMFAWISAPDSVPRTTLASNQIPAKDNQWAGQNLSGLHDPGIDQLLDQLEASFPLGERKQLWQKLLTRYRQTLPAIPLYYRPFAHVLPAGRQAPPLTGHLAPSSLWIEHWPWTPEAQ